MRKKVVILHGIPVVQILLAIIYCIFLIFFKGDETMFHSLSGLFIVLKGITSLVLVFYGYRLLEKFSQEKGQYGKELLLCFLTCLLSQGICYVLQNGVHISIGYCNRYVRTVLAGPLLDSASRWYELLIFAIFVPFLSCMLLHLNEKMKRSLLFVILGYFTFFTIEIFGNITIKIACYPFLNIWGYIVAGWLLLHITWTRKEKTAGIICWILSIAILELEYFCYPDASQMEDFYFIFKCITILGVFCILCRKRRPEGEITILPVLAGIVALVEVFV